MSVIDTACSNLICKYEIRDCYMAICFKASICVFLHISVIADFDQLI
nr:MAG TPA: hypothetical protein [Caudoviricetes sp.]